jgi:hypothetical protein
MKGLPLLFSMVFLYSLSYGRDVVFIGLNGDGAPAIEKTYDRLLREQLTIKPDVRLIDYIESQRYRKMVHFENNPVLSQDQVEVLAKYLKDTTFVVWETVKQCRIVPSRHLFFHARLHGELELSLNIYSMSDRIFVYAGTIKAEYFKSKGAVFFTPVAESFHVSALEQTDILEILENEAVKKTCQVLSSIIRSDIAVHGVNVDTGKVEAKAVDQVLSMPSVGASEVKKDSTASIGTDSSATAGATNAKDSAAVPKQK